MIFKPQYNISKTAIWAGLRYISCFSTLLTHLTRPFAPSSGLKTSWNKWNKISIFNGFEPTQHCSIGRTFCRILPSPFPLRSCRLPLKSESFETGAAGLDLLGVFLTHVRNFFLMHWCYASRLWKKFCHQMIIKVFWGGSNINQTLKWKDVI